MPVGFAEAARLPLLLGEGLDHADAGNGVGEHIGHFRPDPVDLLEAGAQLVAHHMDQPGDEGQGQQGDQGQPGIDREQDGSGHHDHQHVGGEIEQMQRQEHAYAIRLAADARHQIAGALAAEIFQGQLEQMVIGRGAQVGADAFRDQGQDIGLGPAQTPGHQGGAEQAGEQQEDLGHVDVGAILERYQHVIHQGDGQIGRHQGGRGGRQGEQKAGKQLPAIGAGKAPQAEQGPGRWRRMQFAGADRALVHPGLQGRLAIRAEILVAAQRCLSAHMTQYLLLELIDQTQGRHILRQGVAPQRQPPLPILQFQGGHPGMVEMVQDQAGTEGPGLPPRFAGGPCQQALVAHHQDAAGEMQLAVQVNFEAGENVLSRKQLRRHFRLHRPG